MGDRRRRADDAMTVLARERGQALTGYAYLLTGNLRDAEDLVQEALVKTFVRARRSEDAATEAYVRRVVLTTWVDGYRRRRLWEGLRHLVARGDDEPGHADGVDARLDVQTALQALPPQQRACVVLRFYDDLTVPEIAERLALADGTVKRYLSLAVRRLEGLLGATASRASRPDTLPLLEGHPS